MGAASDGEQAAGKAQTDLEKCLEELEEAQRKLKELQEGKAAKDKTASEMSEKEKAAAAAEQSAKDKAAKANQKEAADRKAVEDADKEEKNAENQSKTVD